MLCLREEKKSGIGLIREEASSIGVSSIRAYYCVHGTWFEFSQGLIKLNFTVCTLVGIFEGCLGSVATINCSLYTNWGGRCYVKYRRQKSELQVVDKPNQNNKNYKEAQVLSALDPAVEV